MGSVCNTSTLSQIHNNCMFYQSYLQSVLWIVLSCLTFCVCSLKNHSLRHFENWVFLSQRCNSMQEESMFKPFKSNCIALLSQLPIPLANPPFTGESPTFANA